MARKLTNNRDQSTLTVGLDIGYGVTKAVTDESVIVFPSVASYSREIKFRADEIADKYPGDQIMDDDGSWFVGELALSQSRPGELLRLRGRTANEGTMGNVFRARLMKVALGKLFPNRRDGEVIHLQIAAGLPVDHMRDSIELKQALQGQHLVQTDTTEFVANITKVIVMPQPYGTIYSKMLTTSGAIDVCHTAKRTGVVDVGTYTVDLALDDDGEFIDAESGSVESGVYTAQNHIAEALERDYRQKLPLKTVEAVLRTGCFKAHGQTVNYQDEVQEALEPLRSATLGLIADKWQTGVNVDVIYLSGGGAELVHKQVKTAYRQVELLTDAQLANARGYLSYAHFSSRE